MKGARSIPWKRIVAEFGAIFAGVTLGLLAEGWWQERGDAAAAMNLLVEVREDLRADSVALAGLIGLSHGWDENATRLLRLLPDPDSDFDSLSAAVYGLTIYYDYFPVSAGFVAIRDGGHLAHIPDDGLRRAIVEYHEQTQVSVQRLWTDLLEVRKDFVRASRLHFAAVIPDSATGMMDQPIALRPASSRDELIADLDLRGLAEIQGIHAAVMGESFLPGAMAENQRVATLIRTLEGSPRR